MRSPLRWKYAVWEQWASALAARLVHGDGNADQPGEATLTCEDSGVADRHGDCGGLTEYAYAQAGIAIGGDSRTQATSRGSRAGRRAVPDRPRRYVQADLIALIDNVVPSLARSTYIALWEPTSDSSRRRQRSASGSPPEEGFCPSDRNISAQIREQVGRSGCWSPPPSS